MEVENQIPRDDAGSPAVEQQNAGAETPAVEQGAVAAPPDGPTAGEVGQPTQAQEAAAPLVVEEPVVEEPRPDRQLAAETVTRFLGHQGSVARAEVADLNDAEAWEVIRAAGDRFTARVNIKAIVGRAYDRRREEASKEAKAMLTKEMLAKEMLAKEMPAAEQATEPSVPAADAPAQS